MENQKSDEDHPGKAIYDAISKDDASELRSLLAQYKGSVDVLDENGMSPLQHAAYKGNKDMVQMLLDRGADVNSGKHEYNYTALHFGALSGNSEVCRLLLEAGAKALATNSVGRTAAQMAAFVGNHHTVSTINNFVPRSDIEYYSVIQGQQTEPYIPPYIVDSLHKFVLGVNIHPVRLVLNLNIYPGLMDNLEKVWKVLEMLSKKEMSRGREVNEVMSFKYHYLHYIVKELSIIRDRQKSNVKEEKKHDIVETFSKKLLKPGKDGVSLDLMDSFLRECVREFPFRECAIFHQMITTLTGKDPPPTLAVINASINGQRGFADNIPYCSTCGEEKPAKKCSKCKSVQYCDRECQRLHWFVHKKACNREAANQPITTNTKPNIDAAELSAQLQNLIAG